MCFAAGGTVKCRPSRSPSLVAARLVPRNAGCHKISGHHAFVIAAHKQPSSTIHRRAGGRVLINLFASALRRPSSSGILRNEKQVATGRRRHAPPQTIVRLAYPRSSTHRCRKRAPRNQIDCARRQRDACHGMRQHHDLLPLNRDRDFAEGQAVHRARATQRIDQAAAQTSFASTSASNPSGQDRPCRLFLLISGNSIGRPVDSLRRPCCTSRLEQHHDEYGYRLDFSHRTSPSQPTKTGGRSVSPTA